jgi:predicted RNA-binding Zn-ribbon protein involved in translation (DUF1610 family)
LTTLMVAGQSVRIGRVSRQCCTECGYALPQRLSSEMVCPECGKKVVLRRE